MAANAEDAPEKVRIVLSARLTNNFLKLFAFIKDPPLKLFSLFTGEGLTTYWIIKKLRFCYSNYNITKPYICNLFILK